MKKTIEQKAKAYDEALERAREKYAVFKGMKQGDVLEDVFPELKESEDERIRKEILEYFQQFENGKLCGVNISDWVVWLEKQGEQKSIDKVEPKFKVGDKIRRKTPRPYDRDMQVARIERDHYICNHLGKFSSELISFLEESNYELVEQKPAEWKQENVEELSHFESAMMHIGGSFFGENAGLDPNDTDTIKEQAELLLELAPKTEWGEEDERIYQSIIDDTVQENQLDSKQIDWLKSIKSRVQPKQEWSEEDEDMIQALDACINAAIKDGMNYISFGSKSILIGKVKNWLKSLKQRIGG